MSILDKIIQSVALGTEKKARDAAVFTSLDSRFHQGPHTNLLIYTIVLQFKSRRRNVHGPATYHMYPHGQDNHWSLRVPGLIPREGTKERQKIERVDEIKKFAEVKRPG